MRYKIKTMSRKEMNVAIEWAAEEGWNPGLHDADCFYSTDPKGFLMGFLGDEPVATISVVKYDDNFGFLGFYIVKPEYRGKGYGIQIWDAGLEYLKGRNIGLDGVLDQQDNYQKSGFELAYRNIRYEARCGGVAPTFSETVELSTLPFEIIDSYDRNFFPTIRTRFLNSWIKQADCRAVGIMRKGELAGYGVIRKCRVGYKIGPLFADNPEFAEILFLTLKSEMESTEPLFFDIPEINRSAIALAERHNMTPVFETARMYTRENPDIPMNRLFGVTSFELG